MKSKKEKRAKAHMRAAAETPPPQTLLEGQSRSIHANIVSKQEDNAHTNKHDVRFLCKCADLEARHAISYSNCVTTQNAFDNPA